MTDATTIDTGPRLYVGTYAKYNSGSIAGKWLNLDDYADKDAFLTACAELHKDEADPEFMFQDFEGFPRSMYSESSVDARLWDWIALDDDDRKLLAIYQDNIDANGDVDTARDAFRGKYNSERDFAMEYLDETGQMSELPEWAQNYFDYDSWLNDAKCGGDLSFVREGGEVWVFSAH